MKKEKASSENQVETPAPVEETAPKIVEANVNKVGSLLKEMRLQKGLKLPDIAKKLCIRRFYLEAIEESNYADIPEFPYGVGFIRSYADYLGLNSGNIVELYKEETNSAPDKNIYVLEPQSEATVPGKKYLLISLLAVILIYFGWYFYNNHSFETSDNSDSPELMEITPAEENNEDLPLVVEDYSLSSENTDAKLPVVEVAPVAAPASEAAAPQVVVTDASFTGTVAPVAPVEAVKEEPKTSGIVLNIKKETWVEVKDGEKLYISKVLRPGDTYTIPTGNGMILSVGRVDGVEVTVNGKVTPVVTSAKKMNIALDKYTSADNH